MDKQGVLVAILGFIGLSIPIVGALWKIFAVREQLQTQILSNGHRLALLEQKIDHLVDQQELFLNGLRENLEHVRERSRHAEENLHYRLEDLEGYIEKSPSFTKRRRAG
jgi:hypothetical protein